MRDLREVLVVEVIVVEIMVELKGKAKKVVDSMEEMMVELWEVVERMVVKVVW